MANDLDFFDLSMQPGCTINHVRIFARLRGFTRWNRKDTDYGWAWPSIETLAEACEIHRSTVMRALKWLAGQGYIKPVSRYDHEGHRTSNAYWMLGRDPECPLGRTDATKDERLSRKSGKPKSQKPPRLSRTQGATLTTSENDNTLETTLSADAANASVKRPDTWLTPYGQAWIDRFGGEPPWGIMARSLAKAHAEIGGDALLPRWVRFLAQSDPQFVSVPKFASTHGSYNGQSPALTPRNARNRAALFSWTPDHENP